MQVGQKYSKDVYHFLTRNTDELKEQFDTPPRIFR